MKRILLVIAVAAACGKSDDRTSASVATPSRSPSAPSPSSSLPPLEHSTAADLAREIADADRRGTWRELQHRWQGHTVRWTVTRQRLLCRSADDCNVAAFPIERPAKQGWMPQLTFAPGQYDAMSSMCGEQEQCEVTVEGTVRQLDVSPELPTSVQLSNVRLVSEPHLPRTRTARS
jgi:hypothetical protein